MSENGGNPIFCPIDKKWFPLQIESCIEKYPVLGTIFFEISNCYLMFMFYYAVV